MEATRESINTYEYVCGECGFMCAGVCVEQQDFVLEPSVVNDFRCTIYSKPNLV